MGWAGWEASTGSLETPVHLKERTVWFTVYNDHAPRWIGTRDVLIHRHVILYVRMRNARSWET